MHRNIQIEKLESRVFSDILRARTSFAIMDIFIRNVYEKSSKHYRMRDAVLINAIESAAVDSIISALGRLLQPNAKHNECTLECMKRLSDKSFLKVLMKKQKEFADQIMPWRNKVISHNEVIENSLGKIKSMRDIIYFVEEQHRICHSALEDAGFSSEYLPASFEKISNEWADCLTSRKVNKTLEV